MRKKTSKYVGVSFHEKRNKYRAKITHDGVKYFIGRFKTEREAALAVNQKCLELGIPIKNQIERKQP